MLAERQGAKSVLKLQGQDSCIPGFDNARCSDPSTSNVSKHSNDRHKCIKVNDVALGYTDLVLVTFR